jgi:hypothetical protein
VRIGSEHRLGRVSESRSDDVDGDAAGQRQGRRCMSEDVKAPSGDPGGLAVAPEPLGEPLRVNRAAELVGKDEILVDVGIAAKARSSR